MSRSTLIALAALLALPAPAFAGQALLFDTQATHGGGRAARRAIGRFSYTRPATDGRAPTSRRS